MRREFVMFLEGEKRMLSLENEGSMCNGTEVGRGFWMRWHLSRDLIEVKGKVIM